MNEYRPLLLRGNRFLGSSLVNANLISIDQLEEANQRLLDVIHEGNMKQASILNILAFDMGALDESALIAHTVEHDHIGIIDLAQYDLASGFDDNVQLPLCWATWTLPFDYVDGVYSVATAYYLSKPIIDHWKSRLNGHIIWYCCSLKSLSEAMERVESLVKTRESEAKKGEPVVENAEPDLSDLATDDDLSLDDLPLEDFGEVTF